MTPEWILLTLGSVLAVVFRAECCVNINYRDNCVLVTVCRRFPPPWTIEFPLSIVCKTHYGNEFYCCPTDESSSRILFAGVNVNVKHVPNRNRVVTVRVNGISNDHVSLEQGETIENARYDKSNVLSTRSEAYECGKLPIPRKPLTDVKVVNGKLTRPGDWPWIALITSDTRYCGGSLVSDSHVVTAAHCFSPSDNVTVRLGEYDKKTDSKHDAAEDYAVETVINHPQYRGHNNDIAILKLRRKVEFNARILPICLPYGDAISESEFAHTSGQVAGWGATSYRGPASQYIRQANVVFGNADKCKGAYGKDFTPRTHLCAAGGTTDKISDSCQGDSGGPLVVTHHDRKFLFGIVSYGNECANPGFPGVYTRVTSYMQWIKENMN